MLSAACNSETLETLQGGSNSYVAHFRCVTTLSRKPRGHILNTRFENKPDTRSIMLYFTTFCRQHTDADAALPLLQLYSTVLLGHGKVGGFQQPFCRVELQQWQAAGASMCWQQNVLKKSIIEPVFGLFSRCQVKSLCGHRGIPRSSLPMACHHLVFRQHLQLEPIIPQDDLLS